MNVKQIGNVKLGDLVRDVVSGYTGIVVCCSLWLNGCWRIIVQSQEIKDGKIVENVCFDDLQLEVVEAGKVACGNRDLIPDRPVASPVPTARRTTGGPRDDVMRQPSGATRR